MARKKDEAPEAAPQADPMFSIEDLCATHQVPRWVRAGLMTREGWAAGKRLTEAEFTTALNAWLNKPVGR